MKIVVSGSTGFIGSTLRRYFSKEGLQIIPLGRGDFARGEAFLAQQITGAYAVINLAGAPVLKRWTKSNKADIYNSRIVTTRMLVKAISLIHEEDRPTKFISASAIGIYKSGFVHDETSTNFETGFIGTVVRDWEDRLNALPNSVHKIIFRIGLVLGKESQIMKNLLFPFKLGLGGKIGTGRQPFPFIHEEDLVKAFIWAVEECERSGVFNLVAPEKITNADFVQAFAKKLNRPAMLPVPAFMLRLMLGEVSSLLLEGPIVEGKALQQAGFKFQYPTIDSVFAEILD